MKRGYRKMRVGLKEFPDLIKERTTNPDIPIEELRRRYGNLRVLHNSNYLEVCMSRINHPDYSLQEIANPLSLSREYARLILKQMRLPTKAIRPSPYKFNCLNCGVKSKKIFCSQKCNAEYLRESVFCEVCGKEVKRLKSRNRSMAKRGYKHVFCSKKCQGVWLGHNHRKRISVYDHQLIGRLYSKGLRYKEISKITGANEKYISIIIYKLKKSGKLKPRINIKPKLIRDLLIQGLKPKKKNLKGT